MARRTVNDSTELKRDEIRIRMYRVGFGDCFLVSFPGENEHSHVLVDFGVHFNGNIGTLPNVMADIEKVTEKKLAIVIATHFHQDHISGFGEFADRFSHFWVKEVWLPWTENPQDPEASQLRKKHTKLHAQMAKFFDGSTSAREAPEPVKNILLNLAPNKKAVQVLRSGFRGNPEIRYLSANDSIPRPGDIVGLSVKVLGPPRDARFISKMKQPNDDQYLRYTENEKWGGNLRPFLDYFRVDSETFSKACLSPALSPETIRELKELAEESPSALAAALNVCMNNTSLVTLFSFGREQLLFPGDAEYANWKWWTNLEGADEILSQISFLKVAHHGSVNATPKKVLERMGTPGELSAMVSTQEHPWPSIPRKPLMEALATRTKNKVVRSDSIPATGAIQDAPQGPPLGNLKETNFHQGPFWVDYIVKP